MDKQGTGADYTTLGDEQSKLHNACANLWSKVKVHCRTPRGRKVLLMIICHEKT